MAVRGYHVPPPLSIHLPPPSHDGFVWIALGSISPGRDCKNWESSPREFGNLLHDVWNISTEIFRHPDAKAQFQSSSMGDKRLHQNGEPASLTLSRSTYHFVWLHYDGRNRPLRRRAALDGWGFRCFDALAMIFFSGGCWLRFLFSPHVLQLRRWELT